MTRTYKLLFLSAISYAACIFDMARLADWGAGFNHFLTLYLIAFALYMVIVTLLLKHENGPSKLGDITNEHLVWRLMFIALLVRIIALYAPGTPSLSDDIYRYLWEGRVFNAGFNPYIFAPDAPVLEYLRDDLWGHVNNKDVPTIYPPLLQYIFAVSNLISHSVFAMKFIALVADISLLGMLAAFLRARKLPATRIFLYALNPLVIVEFAGNGHLDAIPIFFLILAIYLWEKRNRFSGAVVLSLSMLTKYFAVALVPIFWRANGKNELAEHKRDIYIRTLALGIIPIIVLLMYWPFSDAGTALIGGLSTYAEHWYFNDSIYRPLLWLTGEDKDLTKQLIAVAFAASVLILAWKRTDPLRATAILVFAFLLMSPTVHPWYVTWIIPFFVFYAPRIGSVSLAFLIWTGTCVLAYHVLPMWRSEQIWEEQTAWRVIEYAPVAGLLMWVAISRILSPRPPEGGKGPG